MLLEFLDKKTVELRKFVEQKNIDKLGLNILFACGMIFVASIEEFFAVINQGELLLWIVIESVILVLITIYFVKKISINLAVYSVIVYCFLDCHSYLIAVDYFSFYKFLPLTGFLRWKGIFVILLIYFILRELQNKNILKFESNTVPKHDNTKIFRVFQFFLLIGAVVFGEIVFVVDTITLGKLPQIVLCIIALTGLAIVICAGYGLDRRYDTKIFLGISPIVYLYKSFGYILVPEFFNEFVTVSYPWMKAMGYIIA